MLSNIATRFIVLSSLLLIGTTHCVLSKDVDSLAAKNAYVVDLISAESVKDYTNAVAKSLRSYGIKIINADSFSMFLVNLATAKVSPSATTTHNEGNSLADWLYLALVHHSQDIGSRYESLVLGKDVDLSEFDKEVKRQLKAHVRVLAQSAIDTDYENIQGLFENSSEVDAAVDRFVKDKGMSEKFVESLKAHIRKNFIDIVAGKWKYIANHKNYRENAVEILSDLVDIIIKISKKNNIDPKESLPTIRSVIDAINILAHTDAINVLTDLATAHVFNLAIPDNKDIIKPICKHIFEVATRGKNVHAPVSARNTLFLNYVFRGPADVKPLYRRAAVHRAVYGDRLWATNYTKALLKFDSELDLAYALDIIYSDRDENILSAADYNSLFKNADAFYAYKSSYVALLDASERYFPNTEAIRDNAEFFGGLYNLLLAHSLSVKNKDQLNKVQFEKSLDNFITYVAAVKHTFRGFDVNMEQFYSIYKLLNMKLNAQYFDNNETSFLPFNDPNIVELYDYLHSSDIFVNLERYIRSKDSLTSKSKIVLGALSGKYSIKGELTDTIVVNTKSNRVIL